MKRGLWPIPASLFAIALVYRLLYVMPIEAELTSDMKGYADCARNLLAGEGLIMSEGYRAYRPPLYPLFLAACFGVFGERYTAVRAVQAVVGAGSVVAVFLTALGLLAPGGGREPGSVREALGDGAWVAATLAGLAAALFDSLIFYCGEFLTETWYVFLLLALAYHLVRRPEELGGRHRWRRPGAVSGVILGLMALLRPAALFLLPGVLIIERRRGASLKGLLLSIAAAAAVISPWTLRNAVVLGAFVPISTNTGVNLYIGHNEYFGYWSTGNKEGIRAATDLDEVAESRYFARLAMEYAASHPWETLRNTAAKFYNLYRPPWTPRLLAGSEAERLRSYKPWPWPGNGAPLEFAGTGWLPTVGWGVLFLAVFLAGLILGCGERGRFLPLYLMVLFHTLAYLVFFGRTRFAVPMMPVFCIFAAYAAMRVLAWAGWIRRGSNRGD